MSVSLFTRRAALVALGAFPLPAAVAVRSAHAQPGVRFRNIVVDVEGPDTAAAFSVIVLYQGDPAPAGELPAMSAKSPLVGWYRDKLVRTPEGWRFAERAGGLDFKP